MNQHSEREVSLNYNLQKLDLKDLLSLIFFVASSLVGLFELSGKSLVRHCSNAALHTAIDSAVMVFDDFPENFYHFLDWRLHQKQLHLLSEKIALSIPRRLKGGNSKFKWFRVVLEAYFDVPKFDFLMKAFYKYLEFGPQGYLSRNYYFHNSELLKLIFSRVKNRKATEFFC